MKLRQKIQDGCGRTWFTGGGALVAGLCCWFWFPCAQTQQESLLQGLQRIAFVAAAFAVTAYNLRTRVVDLVLKVEGPPSRVANFCWVARTCGERLTDLVLMFTLTALWLGGLTIFKVGTSFARAATTGAVALFVACIVTFVYIVFSFERVERYALDEAERKAKQNEADRLFDPHGDPPEGSIRK